MKSKTRDNSHRLISLLTGDGVRLVPFTIERSRRLKRMYLQFDNPRHVTLKLPQRYGEKRGLEFLQQHADWICQTMDRQPKQLSLRQYLFKNPRLALRGRWYRLQLRFHRGSCHHYVDDGTASLSIALDARLPTEPQLLDCLKRIARESLNRRVAHWCAKTGIKVHGVTIRDQRSRWGSCSETGGISLNWRLILISPNLQDHVLLHELAHVRHFDHSRDFHAFLHRLDPRSDHHARMLDAAAAKVFSLGRSA